MLEKFPEREVRQYFILLIGSVDLEMLLLVAILLTRIRKKDETIHQLK